MSLLGPFASCSNAAWGAELKQGHCCAIGNGAFDARRLVEGDDPLKGLGGPGVFGEDAPGKLHPSQEDLAAWFQ